MCIRDSRYDPRFLLPVGFAALRNAGAADAARLARRAHEGGFLAYAVAATASARASTRAYAFGVIDAVAAACRGDACARDRGFGARPVVARALDALRAGAAAGPRGAGAAPGARRGAPRLPALAARVAAGCLAALDSPERDGYAAAHAYALRRPALRPWRDVPLLKEALGIKESRCGFVAVKPFTSLTPESARAKRERRWAMRLLREGCADDASGRLLRNARALPRLLAHLDCVGTGGWGPRGFARWDGTANATGAVRGAHVAPMRLKRLGAPPVRPVELGVATPVAPRSIATVRSHLRCGERFL